MKQDEASDEAILFSDSDVTIKGKIITVSEITYLQGMQLHEAIQPLLEDMASAFTSEDASFLLMSSVFSRHQDLVNEMITLVTGQDESLFDDLGDEEGQLLLMTFWMVNSGFFTRRLASKAIHQMQVKANKETNNTAPSSAS